ncbi:MAG: RtcB family protein, partial [Bacillota bacterium]
MKMEPAGRNRWRLQRGGEERADAVVYLNDALKAAVEPDSLRQLVDAATLPGVQSPVVGMPDLHVGYGLPIGGVMAVSAGEDDVETSVVSAGAVGYDINCGVRLLRTNIPAADLDEDDLRLLLNAILRRVPVGVGKSSAREELRGVNLKKVAVSGAAALIAAGYGRPEDAGAIEEAGRMDGARLEAVSQKARKRGDQLATIGGGNHFIELGEVEEVYDRTVAGQFGLAPGDLTVMIHTGSRGFGHEICS